MMKWGEILTHFLPEAEWTCDGGGDDIKRFESLKFLDGTPKPSFEKFLEWKELYEEYQKSIEYKHNRKREYPPVEDLAVALWEYLVEDNPEAKDVVQSQRIRVKEKYPEQQNLKRTKGELLNQ